jgi:hypothetical protein
MYVVLSLWQGPCDLRLRRRNRRLASLGKSTNFTGTMCVMATLEPPESSLYFILGPHPTSSTTLSRQNRELFQRSGYTQWQMIRGVFIRGSAACVQAYAYARKSCRGVHVQVSASCLRTQTAACMVHSRMQNSPSQCTCAIHLSPPTAPQT